MLVQGWRAVQLPVSAGLPMLRAVPRRHCQLCVPAGDCKAAAAVGCCAVSLDLSALGPRRRDHKEEACLHITANVSLGALQTCATMQVMQCWA